MCRFCKPCWKSALGLGCLAWCPCFAKWGTKPSILGCVWGLVWICVVFANPVGNQPWALRVWLQPQILPLGHLSFLFGSGLGHGLEKVCPEKKVSDWLCCSMVKSPYLRKRNHCLIGVSASMKSITFSMKTRGTPRNLVETTTNLVEKCQNLVEKCQNLVEIQICSFS